MVKKNLSAVDRSGKSLSSTSATVSSVHLDKNGTTNKAPPSELTAEEKQEKFGKFKTIMMMFLSVFFCFFLFCILIT